MKKIIIYSLVFSGLAFMIGCEKDNYDPPAAFVTGKVVYQNNPVQVRNAQTQLELWQDGFARKTKIPVYINQDGSFSANIFNGSYKLVLLRGVGPWQANSDSIAVTVNGTTNVDVSVTPYFTLSNPQISKSGTSVTGTCTITKVVASANLEKLALFLNSTQIVDDFNQVATASVSASALGSQTVSVAIPANLVSKGYFYARLGIKTAGVEQWIFSPVQKL